mgnify:CR=1 FL=1
MDIILHGDFFVEKNMNKDKEEFELRCLGGFVKKINSLQSGFYLEPVFYEINRYEYEEFIFHIVFFKEINQKGFLRWDMRADEFNFFKKNEFVFEGGVRF